MRVRSRKMDRHAFRKLHLFLHIDIAKTNASRRNVWECFSRVRKIDSFDRNALLTIFLFTSTLKFALQSNHYLQEDIFRVSVDVLTCERTTDCPWNNFYLRCESIHRINKIQFITWALTHLLIRMATNSIKIFGTPFPDPGVLQMIFLWENRRSTHFIWTSLSSYFMRLHHGCYQNMVDDEYNNRNWNPSNLTSDLFVEPIMSQLSFSFAAWDSIEMQFLFCSFFILCNVSWAMLRWLQRLSIDRTETLT